MITHQGNDAFVLRGYADASDDAGDNDEYAVGRRQMRQHRECHGAHGEQAEVGAVAEVGPDADAEDKEARQLKKEKHFEKQNDLVGGNTTGKLCQLAPGKSTLCLIACNFPQIATDSFIAFFLSFASGMRVKRALIYARGLKGLIISPRRLAYP